MDLILRSIERMLQTQLSMARRFKLQVLRRYNVKFSKMRNFTFEINIFAIFNKLRNIQRQ
jgi:hypothetical protein